MATQSSKKTSVEQKQAQDGKQETTKKWLARHLLRPISRQGKENEGDEEVNLREFLERPRPAPSTCAVSKPIDFAATLEPPLARPRNKLPPRPPRPNSTVIRDVNAWLDASMLKPAPPLMAGIPYWRDGSVVGSMPTTEYRYAIPIVPGPKGERLATSHSQHMKFFCRRAKKMQVRMPILLRTRSQRQTITQRKIANRRSTSMPLLSIPNETLGAPAAMPKVLTRSRSVMQLIPRLTTATSLASHGGWLGMGQQQLISQPGRMGSPGSVSFGEQESNMERRINAVLGQSTRSGGTARAANPANVISREDSMGNLSDTPTYFSGIPPPSYRSRAASIQTTSSFGCIDGMNAERRLISQRKAAQRSRGMKGKLKKFAQKAHFTK
ncbi:hypothetical protein K469DRAFT_548963 [Zopfia rhizophila CBS 207.26]|uniref:Uncharacterized protein n=1 Tax=Zopfia rhizophila CBS 207.26 TaxID=1314779 RepID=A0A6A6ESU7_9PEZI|nr:hypothetical protein K469DRAFT_548963 [Zopfia rhizophila CBS 207.26]